MPVMSGRNLYGPTKQTRETIALSSGTNGEHTLSDDRQTLNPDEEHTHSIPTTTASALRSKRTIRRKRMTGPKQLEKTLEHQNHGHPACTRDEMSRSRSAPAVSKRACGSKAHHHGPNNKFTHRKLFMREELQTRCVAPHPGPGHAKNTVNGSGLQITSRSCWKHVSKMVQARGYPHLKRKEARAESRLAQDSPPSATSGHRKANSAAP